MMSISKQLLSATIRSPHCYKAYLVPVAGGKAAAIQQPVVRKQFANQNTSATQWRVSQRQDMKHLSCADAHISNTVNASRGRQFTAKDHGERIEGRLTADL